MSKRVIVIADPHVHNYSTFDKDGSRLRNCVALLEEVIGRAKSEGIDTIICCGDFFDKPVLPAVVVNEAAKVISRIPKGMQFLTISGNHDMYTTPRYGEPKGTAVAYLQELCDRFKVFDDESVALRPGTNSGADDARIFGIPYYDDAAEYKLALEAASQEAELHEEGYKVLVMHQTPNGIGNAMIQTDTDPNDPLYNNFDLVLCGHIHQRQMLTDKFLIVGTPLHRSAEDVGQEKGYFILDLDNKKTPEQNLHFVSTHGRYPEFIVVDEGYTEVKDKNAPEGVSNYMIVRPREVVYKTEAASAKDFGAGASPSRMVKAYWNEAGEGDEKLLAIGLKLIGE